MFNLLYIFKSFNSIYVVDSTGRLWEEVWDSDAALEEYIYIQYIFKYFYWLFRCKSIHYNWQDHNMLYIHKILKKWKQHINRQINSYKLLHMYYRDYYSINYLTNHYDGWPIFIFIVCARSQIIHVDNAQPLTLPLPLVYSFMFSLSVSTKKNGVKNFLYLSNQICLWM